MADDYVRETLRTLRERTGDDYVPLSEVVDYLRSRAVHCGDMEPKAWWSQRGFGRASTQLRVAADSLERRWGRGKGPRCWWCREGSSYRPCDCEAAQCEQAELDSPNFTPQDLREFRARRDSEAARG